MGVSCLRRWEKNLIPANGQPREDKRRTVLHWQQLSAAACCQCSSVLMSIFHQYIDIYWFFKICNVACILLFFL